MRLKQCLEVMQAGGYVLLRKIPVHQRGTMDAPFVSSGRLFRKDGTVVCPPQHRAIEVQEVTTNALVLPHEAVARMAYDHGTYECRLYLPGHGLEYEPWKVTTSHGVRNELLAAAEDFHQQYQRYMANPKAVRPPRDQRLAKAIATYKATHRS